MLPVPAERGTLAMREEDANSVVWAALHRTQWGSPSLAWLDPYPLSFFLSRALRV